MRIYRRVALAMSGGCIAGAQRRASHAQGKGIPVRSSRTLRLTLAVLVAVLTSALFAQPASAALGVPRIYLRVLVVTDGSVWVEAIRQQLASEGVPTTVIDLNNPGRPTITTNFLSSMPLLGQ